MNRKNIKTLIKALEGGPIKYGRKKVGFNMVYWLDLGSYDHTKHRCKTTACIAGYANIIAGNNPYDVDQARDWLGLSENAKASLFAPGDMTERYNTITVPQAVTTLKKLLRTGKVDWSHVK